MEIEIKKKLFTNIELENKPLFLKKIHSNKMIPSEYEKKLIFDNKKFGLPMMRNSYALRLICKTYDNNLIKNLNDDKTRATK